MKKLFAILMSIMMIACFMPTMAFAGGAEAPTADATLEIVPAKIQIGDAATTEASPVMGENGKTLAVNADKGTEIKITYEVSITPADGVKLTGVKFKLVVPDGMTLATEEAEGAGWKVESVASEWTANYDSTKHTYTLTDGDGTTKNISTEKKLMTIVATIEGGSAFQSGALNVVMTGDGALEVKKWKAEESGGSAVSANPTVGTTTVNLTRLIGGEAEAITVTAPVKYAEPQASLTLGEGKDFTGTITWKEKDSEELSAPVTKFKADTAYTATVALTANEGYAFKTDEEGKFAVTVDGKAQTITFSPNNKTATFSVDFNKTEAAAATTLSIDVKPNIVYSGKPLVCKKTGDENFATTDADVTVNYAGDVDVTATWHANKENEDGGEPATEALKAAPTNAGVYWIKAVAVSKANKATVSEKSARVEIKKATPKLTLTVKAPIVYDGDRVTCTTDAGADIKYTYDGDSSTQPNVSFSCGDENNDPLDDPPKAAGNYFVTVSVAETKNYSAVTETEGFTIKKAEANVTKAPAAASSLKFTGGYQILITAGETNDGTLLYKVGADSDSYDAAIPTEMEAGEYKVYYMVKGDANHEDKAFEDESNAVPVTISKAEEIPDLAKKVVVNTADKKAQTVSLAGLMPQNAGKLTYAMGDKTDESSIIANGWKVDENGVVTFKLAESEAGLDASKTATLTVTVKSTNYEDSTVTINVKLTAKQVPTFEAPKAKAGLVYNGTDLALLDKGTVTGGTMLYKLVTEGEGKNDPSTENDGFSAEIPTAKNAGPYVVQYKINGAEGFESIEAKAVQVEIAQKEAVISPENCEITEGGKIPEIKLVCAAVVKGDALENSIATANPKFEYYNQANELVEKPTAVGVYTIKWTDDSWNKFTPNDANYDVSRGEGTLTIKAKSSGSGGGSYYPYTPSTPSTPSAPGLDKTKTDSTTALNAAATANKYDAAEQAEVKKILDKANADIKNAKTEAEVKAIEEAAQAEIDKILTTEEKAIVAALDNVEKRDFATKSKVITRKGGKKVIRLTWTAPDGVDVDGYEIFRSTKKNSGFGKKPYFTTSNTSYTNTKDLKAGKTYYYKVRAFVVINGERVYTDYSLKANRKL